MYNAVLFHSALRCKAGCLTFARSEIGPGLTASPSAFRSMYGSSAPTSGWLVRPICRQGSGPQSSVSKAHKAAVTQKRTAAGAAVQAQAQLSPFHLAFPVRDIAECQQFYGGVLGCDEGRSADTWQDFSLFGHQIVCHLVKGYSAEASHNAVDGDAVPVPHYGLALSVEQFHAFAHQLEERGVDFIIKPHLRFKGQPGEQYTMFFKDPSGNALEFKAMTNPANLFAKYHVS